MCDLEKEIKLLKEKVELLQKVKELQEMVDKKEKYPQIIPVPYPVYPLTYPYPIITYGDNTSDPLPPYYWFTTCSTTKTKASDQITLT